MSLAQVYVIFRRNKFVANDIQFNTATINCDVIAAYSPRPCWLIRQEDGRSPDVLYWLTFDIDSAMQADPNTVQGFWIEETKEGDGMMIDIASVTALIEACNCVDCDSPTGNFVTRHYLGGVPAFSGPTPTTYCLTRVTTAKAGGNNLTLFQQVVMDYTGQLENIQQIDYNTGTFTARFQGTSYSVPDPIGDDEISSGVCA